MSEPTIEQRWEAFVRYWAAYHHIEMTDKAKAALLRAFCGNHDVMPPVLLPEPPPPPLPQGALF